MAYINIADWTPDQVTDWLKGLDDSLDKYSHSFTNNEVNGTRLLNIRPYELEQLGMYSIGHQEIVLEAVENLRNFHFNLKKENLQFMALHVATAARCLHRQLARNPESTKLETQTLYDITRTVATIKPVVGWLKRAPFKQENFYEISDKLLTFGLKIATTAQRGAFAVKPIEEIRNTSEKLERLANYIIQDISDPMLLQPASLNLVTFKKRENDLGFDIDSSYQGIHRIIDVKSNSPVHNSGKIEDGDEIVQINYQTVVGWRSKKVIQLLTESVPDVLLTLKKGPKHTKMYGQIYDQPYRLPSKKRVMASRWGESVVPSPRQGFLTVPEKTIFNMPIALKAKEKVERLDESGVEGEADGDNEVEASSDSDSNCSEISTPTDIKPNEKESRLYYRKPRTMLQRRNTICGDEFTHLKNAKDLPLWHERKVGTTVDPSSPSLRDKSVSFGFGLEIAPRPSTCMSKFSSNSNSNSSGGGANGSLSTSGCGSSGKSDNKNLFNNERKTLKKVTEHLNETDELLDERSSKPGVSKVVRFNSNMKVEDYQINDKYSCNVQNTILETFEPIPYADEEDDDNLDSIRNKLKGKNQNKNNDGNAGPEVGEEKFFKTEDDGVTETINIPVITRRGRLDKSHSTPAYDNSGEEDCDTPPAIEPRKEFILISPPIPPPKPRKKDMPPLVVPPPPPKPANMKPNAGQSTTPSSNSSTSGTLKNSSNLSSSSFSKINNETVSSLEKKPVAPLPIDMVSDASAGPVEINELHTPTKAKTLTLKKKHNLMAKRRNVNLKTLGTGEIQGHLYRRKKDKRGVTYWARLYFVMLDTILYGFRTKEANKASCVIFLPGFTVSLAKEVYSKTHAFKVYHSAKTFYFAAESQDALTQWVDFIRQATLHHSHQHSHHHQQQQYAGQSIQDSNLNEINVKDLFSENESSEEENESLINTNLCTPSPQSNKDIHTVLQLTLKNSSNSSTPTTTKTDRNYFGSLKKLTKGSLPFKSSSPSEKKPSSDIPVPTEQYRSYRKVPGGSFGIQIGTNTPGYHHDPQQQQSPLNNQNNSNLNMILNSNSYLLEEKEEKFLNHQPATLPRKFSLSPSCNSILSSSSALEMKSNSNSNSNLCLGPPSSPAPTPTTTSNHLTRTNPTFSSTLSTSTLSSDDSPSKSNKKLPYNFLHASNPNLVEFDFQTSKTLDYSLPKINSSNSWEAHQNTQGSGGGVAGGGGLTLKDLMLQKQKEDAQEMYNNRVLLGVEKKNEHHRRYHQQQQHSQQHSQQQGPLQQGNSFNNGKIPKAQLRSLPKTPDDEISFKPDDEDIKRTRTKEGLKLRDFGYELISGDEPITTTNSSTTSTNTITGSSSQNIMSNTTTNISASRQNSNASNHSQYSLQNHHNWSSAMKPRQFLKSQLTSHKQKKHSSNSCSSTSSADFITQNTTNNTTQNLTTNNDKQRSSSFKKKKLSSERLFHFHKNSSGSNNSMTLPSKKTQQQQQQQENLNIHSNNINSNSSSSSSSLGIKKSHTYNNDLKDKANTKYDVHRKNSAPMPIFSKFYFSSSSSSATGGSGGGATSTTTSNTTNNNNNNNNNGNNSLQKTHKEKKLLGSPNLHRAIFGNHHQSTSSTPSPSQQQQQQTHSTYHHQQQQHQNNSSSIPSSPGFSGRDYDQEIFSQVILPTNNSSSTARYRKQLSTSSTSSSSCNNNPSDISIPVSVSIPTITLTGKNSTPTSTVATPEYPNMECPPVFQPEIYSLTDSNASLSLLLRRNNSSVSAHNSPLNSSSNSNSSSSNPPSQPAPPPPISSSSSSSSSSVSVSASSSSATATTASGLGSSSTSTAGTDFENKS